MTDKQTTDVGNVSESRRNVPIKQESKRHHHVPQLYLKRWCDKHNKLYEFRRFTKNTEVKSHPKSTNIPDLLGIVMTWMDFRTCFQRSGRRIWRTAFSKV